MLGIALVALFYYIELTTVREEEQIQWLKRPKTRFMLLPGRKKAG